MPPTVEAASVNGTVAELFVIVRFFPAAVVPPTVLTPVTVIARCPVVPDTLKESADPPFPLKTTD